MTEHLTGRRTDVKGRSTGRLANSKFRKRNSPPKGEPWIWMARELIESYAWRAASSSAQKVVFRIIAEHLAHGGGLNGDLPVPYSDFERYGIGSDSILLGLAEATALGLITRTDPGHKAWGEFKGRPARYRVCWLPTHAGEPPSYKWKRFQSLQEAKQTALEARREITTRRDAERIKREDST